MILLFSFVFTLPSHSAENEIESSIKIISDNITFFLSQSFNLPIKVAILPFCWEKNDQWALCRVMTELLYTNLSQVNGFELVDKQITGQIIAKLNINIKKGLLEAEDMIKLKEHLACDFIITGHVADEHTIININTLVWNVREGNLLTIRSSQVRKTASVIALLETPYSNNAEHHDYYSVKWRSPILPYCILAISVNDIDGNGINELILITEEELKILSWDGFGFVEKSSARYIDSAGLKRNQKDIRFVYGWDSDGNGSDEIYLSVPDMETSIWKWEKDDIMKFGSLPFTIVAEQKDKILSSFLKSNRNYYSGQKTYEISKTNNIRTEKFLPYDFYTITIGETNDNEGNEILIVDAENIMRIFTEDMVQIWQSTNAFGNVSIIADIDNNKRDEIFVASALPIGDEDFLSIFEWDGNTYAKKWESPAINGSISALYVGDPNNDGVKELIMIINRQDQSEIYLYTANYLQ
jgi:TolB-like protein